MNPNLQRGLLLYGQDRHALAAEQFRIVLASEPGDAHAHGMLSLCLLADQRLDEAEAEARQAVTLAPDFAFAHFAHARVMVERNRLDDAVASISEAIRLEPEDADYHTVHAEIRFNRREWNESLAASETALRFDPEHVGANNLRAMALVKLGRKAEAGATIDATLARSPEDALSHANRGWTLLEERDRKRALHHFRESLRLDPTNEWARAGVVEALKAGNPVYAVMLRYFLWMQKLSGNAQMLVVFGGYMGNRALGSLAQSHPELAPWVNPIRYAYVAFALLTWLAQPLFNLLLRLNRDGRLALSGEQTRSADLVGACLGMSLASAALWAVSGFEARFLMPVFVFFALSLPVSGCFGVPHGWPRRVMAVFAGLMAALALAAVWFLAVMGLTSRSPEEALHSAGDGSLSLFILGCIACPWIVNGLILVRPRR
jgi:tetratricopeptide (TPR) repeat protein